MPNSLFRIIFHIDLNAFFAECEMIENPQYQHLPLAVTGARQNHRGVIVTANYPARQFGIKSGMPVATALRKCPKLKVVTSNFNLYKRISREFMMILQRYTPHVEKASIDEAYLDVTHYYQKQTHPVQLAKTIQDTIKKELKIGCSIGIAPNKFLAKMASDMKKPNGITVLRKRDLQQLLWPLSVSQMYGIGKASVPRLKYLGIETIEDLARYEKPEVIHQWFGKVGDKWLQHANGHDEEPVVANLDEKASSLGHSTTFPKDYVFESDILRELKKMCHKTAIRLQHQMLYAQTISLVMKKTQHKQMSRALTVATPLQSYDDLYRVAHQLFEEHWEGDPLRLIGISCSNLTETKKPKQQEQQLSLFDYMTYAKEEPLKQVMTSLKNKHGEAIISKGIAPKQK